MFDSCQQSKKNIPEKKNQKFKRISARDFKKMKTVVSSVVWGISCVKSV